MPCFYAVLLPCFYAVLLCRAPPPFRASTPDRRRRRGTRSRAALWGAAILPAVSPRRPALVLVLALALAPAPTGCASPAEDEPSPAAYPVLRRASDDADPREAIAAFERDPRPEALLELLSAPHELTRARLGPHRLRYEARFSSTPEDVPELPEVDHGAPAAVEVSDTLELVWASEAEAPPRFHLRQGDGDQQRELIVDDERVFTRLPHRGWLTRPLEGGGAAHWRWLEDAQRSAFDTAQFAAPALAVEIAASDEERVELTLSTAASARPELRAQGSKTNEWRAGVTVDRVEGTLSLTRATGLWRRGAIEIDYHHKDAEGRLVRGSLRWSGELTALEPAAAPIELPNDAAPVPERTRDEVERHELLDALRGP